MKQQGASLVEVLIALVILGVGVIVLVKFQGDLTRDRGYVSQQNAAMVIAKNKIEDLRHYTEIATGGGGVAYDDIASGTQTVTGANTDYTLTWTVTDVVSPPHKLLTVTVSWTDTANNAQSITLNSIVAPNDPEVSGTVMNSLP